METRKPVQSTYRHTVDRTHDKVFQDEETRDHGWHQADRYLIDAEWKEITTREASTIVESVAGIDVEEATIQQEGYVSKRNCLYWYGDRNMWVPCS